MNKKNMLIVGCGGREHALGWKLSQSKYVKNVYYAEGNGGTCSNINIKPDEFRRLVMFAKEHECFTVIGPEIPLANGIVDLFLEEGLSIFGPTKGAALLESSKSFAKHFMKESQIPTANFSTFSDIEKAKDYVVRQRNRLVIKADGLAAGKGVVVCDTQDDALAALDLMMVKNKFGVAGQNVIIEERLFGEEVSFIAICDGTTIIPLASSKDHKRVFDNDQGPNTGGMGSYSPAPIIDSELHEKIIKNIMEPTVRGMSGQGQPFKGFLYAGIMVDTALKRPYVLEYNVRMGDPECQPIMMRLKSDLFEYLQALTEERLDSLQPLEWQNEASVCVIMAAKGYPGIYEQGRWIRGLDSPFDRGIMIFHAGTKRDEQNRIVTNGGRVLGVCALGPNIKQAAIKAYSAVEGITWGGDERYFRTDIGRATYQK
ncbi:MAG: phosphoribosylamine--glycine ligase [Candidatus Nitrosopolaris sp.]